MKSFTRPIAVASALLAALTTFSAGSTYAMGRSGAPTRDSDSPSSLKQRVSRVENIQNDMQNALMEELRKLRKEVDDLKALQALQVQALDEESATGE